MQLNPALAAVLGGQFLLAESYVPAFLLEVGRLLTQAGPTGARPAEQPAPPTCYTIGLDATSVQLRSWGSLDDVPANSVAVTTVSGVMMPDDSYDWDYGYCPGTRTLATRMQQADAHPNIVAHCVIFRTPGGSTMGLDHFAGILDGCQKPVVGYVELMCSAGLLVGSGCDKLVISRMGIAGSIGTKWDGMDFSGMFEKMGIKVVTVTATDSTDKTLMFDEALQGKPGLLRSQLLDPLNDEFLATVAANLPAATDDTKTGKLFVGQKAIDAGLADQLGSLQDAIQLAFDLADEAGLVGTATADFFASTSPTQPTMGLFDKNKAPQLTAVAALAGKATLTAEEATTANQELIAAGITGAQLITQAAFDELETAATAWAAAQQQLTAAGATDVAALAADRDTYKAEAERLGAQPGASSTSAHREGDNVGEPSAASAAQKAIDELPHNKALENHPLFN